MAGKRFNHKYYWRQVHYWAAICCALPVLIIVVTGILLLLKKELDWIQPATIKTSSQKPTLSFETILEVISQVPSAAINSYADIDRLDVRPGLGVIKVRAKNGWEIQLHPETAAILQVSYRRSELIEAIHDGSFFHDQVKLAVFLPSAMVLFVIWLTGIYLFFLPLLVKRRKHKRRRI